MTIELWAGAECTVNRVADRYFDQVLRTGHHDRDGDLELLAELGVRRLRFPVLWERVAPDSLARPDFNWCDRRLHRLRELGIAPIIGLVHHGSGPRYATIDSERFVSGLADFAALVAERYPWVDAYTPVNEPLTTARFCGLYGHWYPHGRDTARFLALLLNEIRATAAAMERIRARVPHAQLVQTEDLGRTFSTRLLAHQRRYENHRRWLSLDLLMGRIDGDHVMRAHLEENGITPQVLDTLVARPCPPDLVGINYYVTSDRFIDERCERYPAHTHGGNGRQRYADVEAVRVEGERIAGHQRVIAETFERYRRPVALTEVHLGCTREEQLRWLAEAWHAAETCARRGADVRAVTIWSAFGALDWDSLLTRSAGHYEPGLFDARCSPPRPTALAAVARALAAGARPQHPALRGPGWWHRRTRIAYRSKLDTPRTSVALRAARAEDALLVVGGGVLHATLDRAASARGLGLLRAEGLRAALAQLAAHRPWAVVLAAEPRAGSVDPAAVSELVRRCRELGSNLALCSSDRVFAGDAERPYVESDLPAARCARGRAFQDLECTVRELERDALIVRTGPLLDPVHPECHARRVASVLDGRAPRTRSRALDEVVSPTFARHALDALLDLLIDTERGIWHLANQGVISLRALLGLLAGEPPGVARDPAGSSRMRALHSERGMLLPPLEQAIAAYRAESQVRLHARHDAA